MMKFSNWFGTGKEYSGIVSGLDAAGKTTLLYHLRLGEVVTTIPTIGFNVETIRHDRANITLWDIGGCDRMRMALRHYISQDKFLIFLHDCSDKQRLDESLDELRRNLKDMTDAGARNMWILFNKQDLLPSDEREQTVKDLRNVFEKEAAQFNACSVKVIDIPGFTATDTDKVFAFLPMLYEGLHGGSGKSASKSSKSPLKNAPSPASSTNKDELTELAQKHIKEAPSVDEFKNSFVMGDIPVWDHFAHLRAGYFVLLEYYPKQPSMISCSQMFIRHLERLRGIDPERFRNTTHLTMTIFWLAQLHVASLKFQARKYLSGLPTYEEFGRVLLSKPELMDSSLWKGYYTKDVMFTPEAKATWIHPDIKPLPTFIKPVPRDSNLAIHMQQGENIFLSTALAVVQETLTTGGRRGEIIKHAFQELQSKMVKLRTENEKIQPYSETQAYFWVQFTHAALAPLVTTTSNEKAGETRDTSAVSSLDLSTYKVMFKISGQEWRDYYSPELWESVPARMGFQNPDLKPLPDVIAVAE